YENLQTFCYYCGKIGHSDRGCDQKREDIKRSTLKPGQFGEWLKASGGNFLGSRDKTPSENNPDKSNIPGKSDELEETTKSPNSNAKKIPTHKNTSEPIPHTSVFSLDNAMIIEQSPIQKIDQNINTTPHLVDIPSLPSPTENKLPESSGPSDSQKAKPLRSVKINRKPPSKNMLVEVEILNQSTPLNTNNKRALSDDLTCNILATPDTKKLPSRMGRLRLLASSQKSLLKILCRRTSCSNGVLCERPFQSQRAFMHSAANNYWRSQLGRHADFATYELLLSKRLIHATGFLGSVEHDYYKILGVSNNATRDEIKAAFRSLAKKYHPDANKNNPTAKRKFQEIRDAYETLQDPEKKTQYDRIRGQSGRTESSEYHNRDRNNFKRTPRAEFSDSFQKIFSEIFEEETEHLNNDIEVELELTFSEAAEGCIKQVSVDADLPCDICYALASLKLKEYCLLNSPPRSFVSSSDISLGFDKNKISKIVASPMRFSIHGINAKQMIQVFDGRGHPLNAEMKICPTCQGLGKATVPPFITTCSTCKGLGRITKDYCKACKGSGVGKGVMEVKVAIPAGCFSKCPYYLPPGSAVLIIGVESGDTIRVAKAGNFGRGGKLQKILNFLGKALTFMWTLAILGGSVEVPTLSGNMQLQIPKGVQHGQLVTLRGKGLPTGGFFVGRGNQYVRFSIKFPITVTERQRVILEELEETIIDENNKSPERS
ncbi:chaperone protein DNAj, partial [Striga asiatica]